MVGSMSFFCAQENQMMTTNRNEIVLYIVGGVLVLLAVMTGLGMTANRIACDGWALPGHVFAPLSFIFNGNTADFGTDPSGCSAPTWLVWLLWGIALVVVAVVVAWGTYAYVGYKQSDKYFIKQVRRRDGLAKRKEVSKALGRKNAMKAVGLVRPSIEKGDRSPEKGCILLGTSEGVPCWISLEESVVLLGPPRSGKGVNVLIGGIIDAPGPVITTSSRADNFAATAPMRRKKGPVVLFDPQGLTGKETTMKWSPITGCEDPRVANQRATSLIGAGGLSEGNNKEWGVVATGILQSLLHAAALEGLTVDELYQWGTSPTEARSAVKILRRHEETGRAASGWASALDDVIEGDEKMRENQYFGVRNAVQGLSVPSVRETLKPASSADTFDVDRFIEECGTLYIIGTKAGGSSAGPFLIAMMDAITQRAREIAAQKPGNRLDPPMNLILDEIANISDAWPGLVQLMADGGGVGISAWAVFQGMAQARFTWGENEAKALWNAATVKAQLGGDSDADDLKVFQELSGEREVIRASSSSQKDHTSVSKSVHDRQVLTVDELRRLPVGWSVVLYRNRRSILMALNPYFNRDYSEEIDQAKKLYERSLIEAQAAAEWDQAISRPPADQQTHREADVTASSVSFPQPPRKSNGPSDPPGEEAPSILRF